MTHLPLHPDDILLFTEITDVMRRVAKHYALPLQTIEALQMPTQGMANRLGECTHTPASSAS